MRENSLQALHFIDPHLFRALVYSDTFVSQESGHKIRIVGTDPWRLFADEVHFVLRRDDHFVIKISSETHRYRRNVDIV